MREYKRDTRIYKISYLLMSDTVDRLDMILLELRHLQRNIIYFMHEPKFNEVLRFEENFLWQEQWEKFFSKYNAIGSDQNKKIDEIINQNIILFPSPSDRINKNYNDDKISINDDCDTTRTKIINGLQNRVSKIWNEEEWGIRHRRSYDSLRGIQLLKRIIVKEKIKFLLFSINNAGIIPGSHKPHDMNPAALAQFIIIRSAIHKRCTQHLARVMEYQSLFNKVLDIGIKEFPVPSLERRREIGIYMDFLNHSVRAVNKQIRHLVSELFKKSDINSLKQKDNYIIQHSWKHHFTSEHHFQEKVGDDQGDLSNCSLHHITTNYWIPERFDLRPIIAHEIAHLIVHEHFDDLSDVFFQDTEKSEFADLLRSIFKICNRYNSKFDFEKLSPAHRPRSLVREITCDMLASSMKCFSYLYASLLESIGTDLHKLLLAGDLEFTTTTANTIDLDLINSLSYTGGHSSTMRCDWWLRLKVMICWLKHIHHIKPLSSLDLILLDGTDSLLDNLLVYLDSISPKGKKRGEVWQNLAESICEEIELSDAVREVYNWRKNRHAAAKDDLKGKDNDFPRSVRNLDPAVVAVLKKIHIGMKTDEGKALHNINRNLGIEFNKNYLINPQGGSECVNVHDYIYNHLYDIPWKCALTRSIDLFGDVDYYEGNTDVSREQIRMSYYATKPKEKLLNILHHDNAMGRELHALALEFYMMNAENPIDRLIHSVHLLKKNKNYLPFKDTWLNEAQKILNTNNRLKNKEYSNKIRECIKKNEYIACNHLDDFVKKFDDFVSNKRLDEDIEKILPLRNYLCFHRKKEDGQEKFTSALLAEMTHLHGDAAKCRLRGKGEDVRCFRMLLVSRYIAGGFYELEEEGSQAEKFNPVSLMKGDTYWLWPTKQERDRKTKEQECAYPLGIFRYSNVSGRYDAMSFVRVRQMHRCSIPHFESKDGEQDGRFKYSQYVFPSMLTRREFGIKIDLNFEHNCDSSNLNDIKEYKNILAGYISVVLKRRSLRLPFLSRLLASAKVTNTERKVDLTKHIHEEKILNNYLRETDTVLLMDGSADFLLILRKKSETEDDLSRLDAVMNLAYWLHQDFMVDRTEIILAASVLDSVAKNISSSKYEKRRFSLECEIRCFEDRVLDYRLDKIKKKLISNIEESQKSSCKYELLVTFEITAGGKDFVLRFFNADVKNLPNLVSITAWKFNKFREDLERLLAIGEVDKERNPKLSGLAYIDRIEVHVNKNPPMLKDELSKPTC